MYRKNDKHYQQALFSSIDDLPSKQRQRLETSWAATFYEEVFCRIDEELFAVLYSEKGSRPNSAINVLVGLEIMKSGFGWSDAELEEQLAFNMQIRYGLGYRNFSEGYVELRTIYYFRKKVARHMQESGENLLERVFEQITDEQLEALALQTGKLRMDSVQIGSNIRQMSRVQLLVEVLQRAWRMLSEIDQVRYKAEFEPYLKGTSGQYVYHIKSGKGQKHLKEIGHLMQRLVNELKPMYAEQVRYAVLARVFNEHFVIEVQQLRPKQGKELSAASLQSPDDWEATYRKKKGVGYKGYVTNVTETCDPENDLQLIVKVQTEANITDDARMLADVIPDLAQRTDVEEIHVDGAYGSPEVDKLLKAEDIELYQSAIRGRKEDVSQLSLTDFEVELNTKKQAEQIKCPHGQQVEVKQGRQSERFNAHFDATICEKCPLLEQCPSEKLKKRRVLYFTQQQLNVARRRQNQKKAKASGRNLRSAVEATVRSLKHPFGNGKLPVRGKVRVSMMMIASAAMTNARRIWRFQTLQNAGENAQIIGENSQITVGNRLKQAGNSIICILLRPFYRLFVAPTYYWASAN